MTAKKLDLAAPPKAPRAPAGAGTIAPHRDGWIARLPRSADPKRGSIGVFPTAEKAREELDAALVSIASGSARALPHGATLATFGDIAIRARVAEQIGGSKEDASRWKAVLRDEIATKPLALLSTDDVVAFRDRLAKVRKRPTVKNTINLLRDVLERAKKAHLVGANVAIGVRPPKRDPRDVHEPWTVLTPEEQRRIAALDLDGNRELQATRLISTIIAGLAIRPGEAWSLELPDFVVDGDRPRVTIRFGSPGKLPKGRRVRQVPLFGIALEAARAWLALLPSYASRNRKGLVFPTPRGARRRRIPKAWRALLARAGVTRRVRFHDLRHTGASSLVSGTWGRAWSLEETKQMLGHRSIQTTEIYAHFGDTVLDQAARATPGPDAVTARSPKKRKPSKPIEVPRSTEPVVGSSNLPGRAASNAIGGDHAVTTATESLEWVLSVRRCVEHALAQDAGAFEAEAERGYQLHREAP